MGKESRQNKVSNSYSATNWHEGVVPIAVEVIALEVDQCQFFVGDLRAGGVLGRIEFGANLQPGACCGVGDQRDDDLVAHERATAPVLGDVAKHPMLDLVPFAGAGGE